MHGTVPHELHESPHAFPAHGSAGGGGAHDTTSWTHAPAASQWPSIDGIMQGGMEDRHGGSMTHSAPQVLPEHASAGGQVNVPAAMHAPSGSHAFRSAVWAQVVSSAAQSVHAAPQIFPAQGSCGVFPHPPRDDEVIASSAKHATARRMGFLGNPHTPAATEGQGEAPCRIVPSGGGSARLPAVTSSFTAASSGLHMAVR